jgi:hypothetical protein
MSPTIRIDEDTKRAINELGSTFDSADDVLKRLIREAGHNDLLQNGDSESNKKSNGSITPDSKIDLTSQSVDVDSKVPPTLHEFVVNWGWPSNLKKGSTQAKNVAGVIWGMMAQESFDKDAYNWAVEHRADRARREDSSRGEDYESTVRASCVRGLGFSGDGATRSFRNEAKRLVRDYQEEYR